MSRPRPPLASPSSITSARSARASTTLARSSPRPASSSASVDGPYGECVYNGRNDVVDHQVVNLQYEGGATASFTMTAFTGLDFRKTRVFGTHGSLDGDGRTLTLHDFLSDTREVFDFDPEGGASAADGHGGADDELIRAFLAAIADDDRELVNTGPDEALRSHLVVWAAERARHSGQVVRMP